MSETQQSGSGPTRVYLVRHGRTELNAAGIVRGRLDPPLDDVGCLQVEELARALSLLPIDEVVAGPLGRTTQTAQVIAHASGAPLSVDARLQDRDYGEWTGHSVEAVVTQWGSLDDAPGVESLAVVAQRAWEACEALADRWRGGLVVAVTHDAVIRALVTKWRHIDVGRRPFAVDTASYTVVERLSGEWRVLSIGNHVE